MNKKSLTAILLSLCMVISVLSGCTGKNSNIPEISEEQSEELSENAVKNAASNWVWSSMKENVDPNVDTDPKDDFYLYVNKDWILENEIQDGYSSYTSFNKIFDGIEQKQIEICKDETLTEEDAQKVRELYNKVLDWDSRNELGYAPIADELEEIQKIQTLDDYYEYSLDTSTYYKHNLFEYGVIVDFDNTSAYVPCMDQRELLLNDAAEYTHMSEYGEERYQYYLNVYKYMMGRLGIDEEESERKYEEIINLEKLFAKCSYTSGDILGDAYFDKINNRMTVEEVENRFKAFPFERLLEDNMGLSKDTVIIVTSPEYFDNLENILKEENIEVLKDYQTLLTLTDAKLYLDEETYRKTREIYNEAYGVKGCISDEAMACDVVKDNLSIAFQKVYAAKYGSPELKKRITDLCDDVIETYKEILRDTDVLGETSKNKAIEKLEAMQINVLYPDKWPDVSELDVRGLNLYDSKYAVEKFNFEYALSILNSKVDNDVWIENGVAEGIMDCNAYYNPLKNSIILTLGIIDDPIYREDMSDAELYATVGYLVGHEISHAFDSSGSQFDKEGNYKEWWTSQERKDFNKLVDKLDTYLSSIEIGDGYFLNAENTHGELMADYTGIQCMLKMAERKENFDYDLFFKTFARVHASIRVRSYEVFTILNDPHPSGYLRINIVVQQFEEFYQTYGVKEGDGMYLAPADRVLIW